MRNAVITIVAMLLAAPAWANAPFSGGGPFNGGATGVGVGTAGQCLTTNSGANGTIWGSCSGGASVVSLGASTSAANPEISGDATSGFYSAGAGLIDAAVGGVNELEISATGTTTVGVLTVSANAIIITTTNTPSHTATCTAGTLWWDASYLYLCTASGTVKRAALSTF